MDFVRYIKSELTNNSSEIFEASNSLQEMILSLVFSRSPFTQFANKSNLKLLDGRLTESTKYYTRIYHY